MGFFSYMYISFHICVGHWAVASSGTCALQRVAYTRLFSRSLLICIGLFSNINKTLGRCFLWRMRSTKSGVYTSLFEVSFDMYWSLFTYKQGIGPSRLLAHTLYTDCRMYVHTLCICEKRPIHIKRDQCTSENRLICMQRDLYVHTPIAVCTSLAVYTSLFEVSFRTYACLFIYLGLLLYILVCFQI